MSELERARNALSKGLGSLGFGTDGLERWLRFTELLEEWGGRMNLTGHRGAHAIAQNLLLEAAALASALPPARSIVDLGSGAGIPGIPLALCRPECQVLLIDSRERRHHFQRAVIRELELSNVTALRGRAEELVPEPAEGVVAQAFAQPDQALHWMLPWCARGGWLALASRPGLEIQSPGGLEAERVAYAAPAGPAREVWIGRVLPAG